MTSTPPEANTVYTAAMAWHAAGASVVRVALDGTKRPLGEWKQYQHQPANQATVHGWFADGHPGLGIITGAASGQLEMLELEGRAVADIGAAFMQALDDHGLHELKLRLMGGYGETSPSGGIHLLYRVDGPVGGNTKLAQREARDDELTPAEQELLDTKGKRARRDLIETRGEGGFVVVAPSHGPVHPSGLPYKLQHGHPSSVPTITEQERDDLHAVATLFDEIPAPEPIPDPTPIDRRTPDGGTSPGDDFNQRGRWDDILAPAGWTLVRRLGDKSFWRRPGKNIGISAVTGGDKGDYFYNWSSSTELPQEQALSKWRLYALTTHAGDFHAAAQALKQQGYGEPAPEPTRPVLTPLPTLNMGGTDGSSARQPEPAPAAAVSTFSRSDDGNALALVDAYGDRIRYCVERGRWLHWTGTRWDWCGSGDGTVREYAKQVARQLPEDDQTDVRWKQRSLSANGITAMLTQSASDPRIVVSINDLDAHPRDLNTPAGIVDLTTGHIRPHDPDQLHTQITTAAPDFTADTGRWHQFLVDTFGDDTDLVGYVQRLLGYSASGEIRDHILPFCFGDGGNGKGVLLESALGVLGDYASSAPNRFLMAQQYAGHETEIARLTGKRMVVCSEVNDNDRFDEAKVKQLTGGDTLTARFMRADHFTFTPTHKLFLLGNSRPDVTSGGGNSFWRRLRLLPFTRTIPDDKKVDDLQGILARDHGGAVLAWIIRGAVDYYAGGLRTPGSVLAATADYERGEDNLARFIADECHLAAGNSALKVTTKAIRERYVKWCHREEEPPVSAKRFGMDLRNRFGVYKGKSNNPPMYEGITLHADPDEQGWQPE